MPPCFEGDPVVLGEGWTMRPVVSHVAGKDDFEVKRSNAPARSCTLGSWHDMLGRTFSGKVEYRVAFDSPCAGKALLDLGKVCWCASVRMNGCDAYARFFGPFQFEVELEKGHNVLEVTVANLLANQVGDPDIRARIAKDYPPFEGYEYFQGPYDGANHDSGLYGPVTIRPFATSKNGARR